MATIDIYNGFKTKDLQANQLGIKLKEVTFSTPDEVLTDVDVIDFGSDIATNALDLGTVITGDVITSCEKALILTSNFNLSNLRAWASYSNFGGGLEIRYAKGAAVVADPTATYNNDGWDDDTTVGGAFTHPRQTLPQTNYGANEKIPIPGTLEDAQFSDSVYGNHLELGYTTPESERLLLQLGAFPSIMPNVSLDAKQEVDSDGYSIPLGHLCFYGEFADYRKNFQIPQGFAHLFALLPSFEVNLVDSTGVERSLGFLEDTVSMNFSTTTADNMSGYPSTYQSIIVTQRNSEITGNLSDLDPAMFAKLGDFPISQPLDTSGNSIGTTIELGNNTTFLPDYGLVLRGWFQNQVVVEFRFPKAKAYINGNIDIHHVATRVPFTIVPVSNGTMFVGGNKGFVAKYPIVLSIIPA